MNKRILIRSILPLLIVLLAGGVAFLTVSGKAEPKKRKPVEKVWLVDVLEAAPDTRQPELTLYGQVESAALQQATAPAAGVVEQVLVQPGQEILAGQLLLAMDARDFTLNTRQAQAEVDEVRAQLAAQKMDHQADLESLQQEQSLLVLAQQELQRLERLKRNNLSSESALSQAREMLGKQQLAVISRQLKVDRFESQQKQLLARLEQAQSRLQQARLVLQRSRVEASADGVVAALEVAAGDRVRAGDALLSQYAQDSLQVRASIPLRYQYEIQQALSQHGTLQAHAELAGQSLPLSLVRLAGTASLSGIDGYFELGQTGSGLRHGNLLKLVLERPAVSAAIALPFSALYGTDRVFVMRQGRMVSVTVETLGQLQDEMGESLTLIRSTQIRPGEAIVITHLPNAVDGLKIKTAGAKDDA